LAPEAATVLNVAEDHLDWHGSLAADAAAKGRIYRRSATAVYNADDAWSTSLATEMADPSARVVACTESAPAGSGVRRLARASGVGMLHGALCERSPQGEVVELARQDDITLPGSHNIANAVAAAALARSHGVPASAVGEGLRAFTPGEHRTVEVAEINGVRYIDDSKATNPHAAAGSLRAYPRLVWIA